MAKGIKTGGRKPGSTNKVGKDIRDLAQKHTKEALATLAEIMGDKDAPAAARAAAANHLLDRGHGKAPQAVTGEGGEGPVKIVVEWQESSE